MAAIAFDPLEYARALESSGVPREQAEVHAKVMTQMFVHNMDALVTRDYLDTRFNEFESRIGRELDQRFGQVDARFAEMEARFDARFAEIDARFDARFAEMDARFDVRFAEVDVRFARINVTLGIILVAVAVPMLQTLIGWVS
ncbi:hypothetical protein F0M18_17155 [Pseudohalioglobus sediminis]|uniref:DUF1640 domain-containing protein n=1 Tax=Pseudohalioglobus sediminis TaxID=2606449 RepID=A0A5B0WRS3_9GAMM|nr:hypothetical protein [Pseudohalioglobus sediminis]KAA1188931.1 hypothetical protein F0M18_17155 [Pseudohalioglobus sediminis]